MKWFQNSEKTFSLEFSGESEMGKLVVLLDLGMRKTCSKSGHAWSSTTTLLILLLLMAICCVGNHGSEVRGGTYKEVVATHPVASPLKQSGEDGVSVGIVNGGKPGIESYGNVTVLAGQRGELKCRTFNLANYTVSHVSLLNLYWFILFCMSCIFSGWA